MKEHAAYDCVIQALRTATVVWRESRRFFAPFGVTEAQFNVLNILGQARDGMSQRELGDLLIVDRSNVTLLLDRMAKKTWIIRKDVPHDRRAYRACLTPQGKALWKKILPGYAKAVEDLLVGVSLPEMHTALRVLQIIELKAKERR